MFGVAAYLFIDIKPGATLAQKIDVARLYIKHARPEAAIGHLNKLLISDKLEQPAEAEVHVLLSEALDLLQQQKKLNVEVYHERIVQQGTLAINMGWTPDAKLHLRIAASQEALGHPAEALANYRKAAKLDENIGPRVQKKIIELHIEEQEGELATIALEQYLKTPKLSDSERAWAIGEQSQLLIDKAVPDYQSARALLAAAQQLELDETAQGQILYRLAYAYWKLGDHAEAERHFREARKFLTIRHALDADACYALGRIYQDRGDPATAASFFQIVLISHPGAKAAILSRLERGVCRLMLAEDDAGLNDLTELVRLITARASRSQFKTPAIEGLRKAATVLTGRGNNLGALEVLAHEQTLLGDDIPPAFFARLGAVYERRAEQVEQAVESAKGAERPRLIQQARDLRCKAGDASVAYSRGMTMARDGTQADALWRGIDLYDRAGDLQRVISALEVFTAERPDDALTPDALLRLGQSYQAAGLFDKAIATFQRVQFRYPQSLAASKCGVPLARAYIAKGPVFYSKAETSLLALLHPSNKLITPKSEEFKTGLFEIGQLYYRTGRYEEAVSRLEEWTKRYPGDDRTGQLIFLMADSYRKSATLLDANNTPTTRPALDAPSANLGQAQPAAARIGPADASEVVVARRDRLSKAKDLYERLIEMHRNASPKADMDKLYLKLSHFYRADCVYDLGNYEEAIKLYDRAAFRYQDDPAALAAYVQIVNAYCALGKMQEAKTANERAKWLLKRMPADAFADGTFAMKKDYWEKWLQWTTEAGLW